MDRIRIPFHKWNNELEWSYGSGIVRMGFGREAWIGIVGVWGMPIQRHSIANWIISFVTVEVGVKQTNSYHPLSNKNLSKPLESTSEQNKKAVTIYCPIFQMLECHREINCLHRRQSYSFTHIVCPHPVAYNRRQIGKCCCPLLDDRWWWSSASVILQIDSSHWGKPTIIKVPLFRLLKPKASQPNWRVVSSGRSDNHFTINEPTLKASR